MIGDKIKKLRKKKGLTQIELAEKASLNKNSIARYERDEISPTEISLQKIADALEVSPSELFDNSLADDIEEINIGYWGTVFDNAKKVVRIANPQELSLIFPLIKSAYEVIAKTQIKNCSEIKIEQTNLGHDATINFNQ